MFECECVNVWLFKCVNVWMFECYPADELMFHIFRFHTRLTHHQTGLDHVEEYSLDQETYPEHYVPHRYRIYFPPDNNEYIFPDHYFFPDKFFFFPDNNEYIFPGFLTTILLFHCFLTTMKCFLACFPDILFVPCQPWCFFNDSGGVFAEHVHGLAPTEKALLLQAHVR